MDMAADDKKDLKQLRRQLAAITAERDRLLAENERLRSNYSTGSQATGKVSLPPSRMRADSLPVTGKLVTGPVALNNESPLFERVKLFRSLFRGREDVFARQWWSRKSQRVGYSPVCLHEWNPAYCGKPNAKCGDCPNQEYIPLTDEVIQDHLEGRHTVGIYPLLPDETCHFLAADFDKQSWMEDAAAFLEMCRQMEIPAAVERSRSGNGAHVWIFFAEAVPSSTARKLGCYLLTETMSHRHQLGMDSYDRLFPNQDTLPKGGFGNLIALPLQKRPVEKENTLFLDDTLKPHEDQWAFLSSITRMELPRLNDVVKEATRTGQIIGVRASSSDEEERPWAMPPSRRLWESLPSGPFPDKVRIVMSNLLYVEKQELPSPLLNRIKRLAAFQNPEFYKKQNLRLSTARTPRVICCAEDFPKHLAIPRGCLSELQELLESAGIKLDVVDERFQGTEIDIGFHVQLTSTQKAAVTELARHDDGVLVAPAGSGKTVMGIYMIAARRRNTLVLVHRRPLLEQWRAQLSSFLEVDPAMIGQIGGGKEKRTGLIDVAMLQSLIRKNEVDDIVAGYGQVLIDECHHLPAVTFEQVLRQVKALYVIGLTATPYRRDGQQPIILMQCGPVRHTISQKDRQTQELLRHRLICRDTSFTVPTQEGETSIHDIYAALVADEARNALILNDLLQAMDEGHSPILLTERREHLEFFISRLEKSGHHVVVLRGGMGAKQRRSVAQQIASIPDNEKRVLLATGRYVGEGFDDARLDTLFLAMPVSWKGTLVQYAGRLHRIHAGKAEVCIYDYVDRNSPTLMRMFHKRLRGYRAMGYEQENPIESAKMMFELPQYEQ
ncbi:MAG: DEAD/DEAH box helicase family protein [Dehalococcoidales bacterium]|nr:DEAD/DEAH box helicase family protein [Dehalococcoidales bacterium]